MVRNARERNVSHDVVRSKRVRVRESVRENEGRRTSRTSLSTMTLTSAILFHRMVEWRVFAVSGSFAVSVTNGGESA